MSTGLTALALTLGVLFPNFHDSSPARIVSGFGGTLCLILNFIYILIFMSLFVWQGIYAERHQGDAWAVERLERMLLAAAGLLAMTAAFTGIPLYYSLRRMKKLELLGTL
jgi:ABC-2 type transport system permease protein